MGNCGVGWGGESEVVKWKCVTRWVAVWGGWLGARWGRVVWRHAAPPWLATAPRLARVMFRDSCGGFYRCHADSRQCRQQWYDERLHVKILINLRFAMSPVDFLATNTCTTASHVISSLTNPCTPSQTAEFITLNGADSETYPWW